MVKTIQIRVGEVRKKFQGDAIYKEDGKMYGTGTFIPSHNELKTLPQRIIQRLGEMDLEDISEIEIMPSVISTSGGFCVHSTTYKLDKNKRDYLKEELSKHEEYNFNFTY